MVAGQKAGGQFKAHERAAAAPPALPSPQPVTAAEVLAPDFTVSTIREHFGPEFRYRDDRGNGITRVACDFWSPYTGSHITLYDMDENGDVIDVQEQHPNGFGTNQEKLDDVRHKLRLSRLEAMGVNRAGAENDGGSYGRRFVGSRRHEIDGYLDASKVSREVRKDLKRAKEFRVLPDDVEVKVTTDKYAGGQAVRIDATFPAGRVHTGERPGYGYQRTAEARSVDEALEAIGNQWNDYETESMTDYYRTSYHLSVQISER